MQLIDIPTDSLRILLRKANPREVSALMRTCHQLYEKLAPELYKDLPVLRLSDLTYEIVECQEKARLKVHLQMAAKEHTGAELALISDHYERIMHLALVKAAPMSVGHLQQYGAEAKNLILHVERLDFLPQSPKNLDSVLRAIFRLFSNSLQLEVFGFTTSFQLSHKAYNAFVRMLQTNIRPRILLLPYNVDRNRKRVVTADFPFTIFGAQYHIRRGGAMVDEDSDTVYRHVRERPNVASDHRKFLDVYAPEGTDLEIVKTAIKQPVNVIEEVTLFGTEKGPYELFPDNMDHVCRSVGLNFEDLHGLHLHHCMLGRTSSLSGIQVSDKLRSISIVNSFADPRIVDFFREKHPQQIQPFFTTTLLRRIKFAHAGSSSPKPNRFIYRQYTTRGSGEDRFDPISGALLLDFISISDEWKVMCFHRDIPYRSSITSLAFKTLVYASFRFGDHEQTMGDLTAFGKQAPNLQWLGVNHNKFTRRLERPDKTHSLEDVHNLGYAIRSMKKLRVLCLFANAPRGGHKSQSDHILDEAVKAMADVAVRYGVPIKFIHLIFRNIDSVELGAAISYRIGRTESKPGSNSTHLEQAIPNFTVKATVFRVESLPYQDYEDLEAMGGGKRFDMRSTLADTLGHLYVTQEDMMKRLLGRISRVDKAEQSRVASSGTKRSLSPQGYEGEPEAKAPRLADDAAV